MSCDLRAVIRITVQPQFVVVRVLKVGEIRTPRKLNTGFTTRVVVFSVTTSHAPSYHKSAPFVALRNP